jgi:hypothetical protein
MNRFAVLAFSFALSFPFLAGAQEQSAAGAPSVPPMTSPAITPALTPPENKNPNSPISSASAMPPISPDIAKIVDPNSIPALRNIIKPGTEVRFLGNEYGMKGYMLLKGPEIVVVYVTPDNQGFMIGALFSADAVPTTVIQLMRTKQAGFEIDKYVDNMNDFASGRVKPPGATVADGGTGVTESPGEKLLTEVSSASWIAYGPPSAPMVTAFMDPNCSHCHKAFLTLKPLADAGKIYMRVVPINIMKPAEGRPQLVNILSTPVPADAWAALMRDETVPPPAQQNPAAADAVDKNTALFNRWKLPGTPYFVYRGSDSKVKILYGATEDLKDLRADLGIN